MCTYKKTQNLCTDQENNKIKKTTALRKLHSRIILYSLLVPSFFLVSAFHGGPLDTEEEEMKTMEAGMGLSYIKCHFYIKNDREVTSQTKDTFYV